MKAFIKRERVVFILAAIALLISVPLLAKRLVSSTSASTPTPTTTPTLESGSCPGELIGLGETTLLGDDTYGRPVYLYVNKGFEAYATLIGEIEVPENSGNWVQFQPSVSVVRERTKLQWRGVKVAIRECIPGLVYRYEILEKP